MTIAVPLRCHPPVPVTTHYPFRFGVRHLAAVLVIVGIACVAVAGVYAAFH